MPRHLLSPPELGGHPWDTGTAQGTARTRRQRPAGPTESIHAEIQTGIPNLFFYALINSIFFFFFFLFKRWIFQRLLRSEDTWSWVGFRTFTAVRSCCLYPPAPWLRWPRRRLPKMPGVWECCACVSSSLCHFFSSFGTPFLCGLYGIIFLKKTNPAPGSGFLQRWTRTTLLGKLSPGAVALDPRGSWWFHSAQSSQ